MDNQNKEIDQINSEKSDKTFYSGYDDTKSIQGSTQAHGNSTINSHVEEEDKGNKKEEKGNEPNKIELKEDYFPIYKEEVEEHFSKSGTDNLENFQNDMLSNLEENNQNPKVENSQNGPILAKLISGDNNQNYNIPLPLDQQEDIYRNLEIINEVEFQENEGDNFVAQALSDFCKNGPELENLIYDENNDNITDNNVNINSNNDISHKNSDDKT